MSFSNSSECFVLVHLVKKKKKRKSNEIEQPDKIVNAYFVRAKTSNDTEIYWITNDNSVFPLFF